MLTILLIILGGALSIAYGLWAINDVMRRDAGTQRMQEIAGAIAEGAQAYLRRQYATIAVVGVILFGVLVFLLGIWVAIGFAIGAILSAAAGFIGMNVSVRANVRTAQAATQSLGLGLDVAFKSGAVTGMLVAGLALLGVVIYYAVLTRALGFAPSSRAVIDALVALGFGASLISIFARSAAASSPRARTSAATSWARSRPAFPRTIRATPPPSPTTWATMSATAPAWRPTCSRPTR
jgi:K(+)-stimulated pyrophosphate-energized sodium pump